MDLFNTKKIEKLEKENKEIKKLLVDLNKKIIKIEEDSVDWDEYKKWKEMKDSLPKISEMFKIKDLKILSLRLKALNKLYNEAVKIKMKRTTELQGVNIQPWRSDAEQRVFDAGTLLFEVEKLKSSTRGEIDNILKEIDSNKDIKIVELLKLYGIKSDWILEK